MEDKTILIVIVIAIPVLLTLLIWLIGRRYKDK